MAFDAEAKLDAACTAFHENVDYFEAGSATKAAAFAKACLALMQLLPSMSSHANMAQIGFDLKTYNDIRKEAIEYATSLGYGAAATGGGVVRYPDFTERGD